MKKILILSAALLTGFFALSCGDSSSEPEDDPNMPAVKIEVGDIADNKATVTAALEKGNFYGAKIVTGVRVSTLTLDYTREIPLIKYVEANGTAAELPFTTQLTDLIAEILKTLGRNTHGTVAVPVAAGAVAEAATLKVTAEGPHEIADGRFACFIVGGLQVNVRAVDHLCVAQSIIRHAGCAVELAILFHGRFRRGGRTCAIGVAGCCGLCGVRAAAADKQSKEQECCQQDRDLSSHFLHLFSNHMWADLSSDKTRTYREKFPKCCSHRTQ